VTLPSSSPARPDIQHDVRVLLVMGVSGSGKTTIGSLLAAQLGWAYAEADSFHPAANLAKMAAGHPLDDADRIPWLAAIGAFIDRTITDGRPAVVTCSALKRSYREFLRAGRPNLKLLYLEASPAIVKQRLQAREGHFFPADLLTSQYRDLEPPGPDEDVLHVSVDGTPQEIVDRLTQAGIAG